MTIHCVKVHHIYFIVCYQFNIYDKVYNSAFFLNKSASICRFLKVCTAFSNYDAANVLVKASHQRLGRPFAAPCNENPVKYNTFH